NPVNSTGTTNPINTTGTTNPISSVGTVNSTGTTNPINSTGTTNPANSVGTTNPINTTGTPNPINPTGTANPLNAAGATPQTIANINTAAGGTVFNTANGSVNADLGVSLSVVNNGVMVTSLGGTGALANIGLQVGDQIVGINGQQVSSIAAALNGLLQAAQQGQNSLAQTATMTISRNGVT